MPKQIKFTVSNHGAGCLAIEAAARVRTLHTVIRELAKVEDSVRSYMLTDYAKGRKMLESHQRVMRQKREEFSAWVELLRQCGVDPEIVDLEAWLGTMTEQHGHCSQ